MRHVIESWWRQTGVAVLLVLLATSVFFPARPTAYGDDKAPAGRYAGWNGSGWCPYYGSRVAISK
jgi:hypothetical protein